MLQPCCINKYYPHTESARHEIEEEVNMIVICIHKMSKKSKPNNSNKELERLEAEQKGMDENFGSLGRMDVLGTALMPRLNSCEFVEVMVGHFH